MLIDAGKYLGKYYKYCLNRTFFQNSFVLGIVKGYNMEQ